MDKNLHNMDEIFNEAYKNLAEKAPSNGWEKLQAGLDKQDADKYKRRFIGWKRIAILLLFLLSGFIIYETGIVKQHNEDGEKIVSGKLQPQNDSSLNTNDASVNATGKTGRDVVNAYEESPVLNPRLNADNLPKNQFLPTTVYPGAVIINPFENFMPVDKNKKYSKQKTKISIKPGEMGYAETGNITVDIAGSKINKYNPEQEQDDLTTTASPRRVLAEKITLPEIEKKIIATPKVIIKTVLPLIASNATANSSSKNNKKFKPYWTATPFISNDWSMYQLDNDVPDNTGNIQNEKQEVSRRERHESSYSAGVTVTRQLSKHIGVKAGVVYSNTAIAISPQEIYAVQQDGKISYKYITSSGYGLITPGFGLPPAVGDSIKSAEAQHNLQIISIPVAVSYRIDKKKFSIIPSAGLSANFITSARVKTEVSDALNKEAVNITGLDGMKRYYTGFFADVNVQYNINKKLAINLLPTFKYALSPITKNNVVKTYPYSFGIGAGLTFKF